MSDRYLWDRSGTSDPEVEHLEEALAPLRYRKPEDFEARVEERLRARARRRRTLAVRVAVALAAVLGIALFVVLRLPPRGPETARHLAVPSASMAVEAAAAHKPFAVTKLEGQPSCNAEPIGAEGALGVGQWLETDAASRARIAVADIGQVEVGPGSRVRLSATGPKEHRLELERGRIHATVDAPPRLFVVGTPSVTAVDLGCEYDLEVDAEGGSVLRVASGYVSLEWKKRTSLVPAGAACRTVAGKGPGTPYFEDAAPSLVHSLAKFDFEGGGERAVTEALAAASRRDSLSLWHLLFRVAPPLRGKVYERLAELVPPPEGAKIAAESLDRDKLRPWKERMRATWASP